VTTGQNGIGISSFQESTQATQVTKLIKLFYKRYKIYVCSCVQ